MQIQKQKGAFCAGLENSNVIQKLNGWVGTVDTLPVPTVQQVPTYGTQLKKGRYLPKFKKSDVNPTALLNQAYPILL